MDHHHPMLGIDDAGITQPLQDAVDMDQRDSEKIAELLLGQREVEGFALDELALAQAMVKLEKQRRDLLLGDHLADDRQMVVDPAPFGGKQRNDMQRNVRYRH